MLTWHFLENMFFLIKSSLRSPGCVLLCGVWKVSVCWAFKTLLVHPSFVPRLADVLPLLLLCVWKGQQGQHGGGKEGRLCPAWPPGCPEGKGAWRAMEKRKGVGGKKRHFPSSFFLSLAPVSPLAFFPFIFSFLPLSYLSLSPPSWLCSHWLLYLFFLHCEISEGPAHVKSIRN